MCCDGDLLTRGLLLLNASSVLLATRPLFRSRFSKVITVALVFASALQFFDVWDLTFGFWKNFALICLGICLIKVVPFVWMVVLSSRTGLEEKFPGKFRPLFFFCSTTHARFLPKKHTFKYPLLYVGFPVTMKGSVGGLFSVLESKSERAENLKLGHSPKDQFTFFSIDPASYTNPDLPFETKLNSVLTHHVCRATSLLMILILTCIRELTHLYTLTLTSSPHLVSLVTHSILSLTIIFTQLNKSSN